MNTSGIGGVGYVAFTVNRSITYIVRVRTPKPTPSDGPRTGDIVLTERVSNSPSGEYRPETITCLFNGRQAFMKAESGIKFVRDRGGSTAQVHGHKYLRFVLWRDETTSDHCLYDEDANNGQQHQLCNTDGNDCCDGEARNRTKDLHPRKGGT